MGQAACRIIIDGNKAYASVEDLADRYKTINVYMLEAAITASCNIVPYVSLYLKIGGKYLSDSVAQPIVDIHARIIDELATVEKADAQNLVDELAHLLFEACDEVAKELD